MRISEIGFEGQRPIDSYGGGGFRVNDIFHEGGLLVTPEATRAWPVSRPAEIAGAALAALLEEAGAIDILLIGTGAEIAPLPAPARRALEDAGLGVEPMSTASACRTYNVLLGEGRRIAAALIAV